MAPSEFWIDAVIEHVRNNDPRLVNYMRQFGKYGIYDLLDILYTSNLVREAVIICKAPEINPFPIYGESKDYERTELVKQLDNGAAHDLLKIYMLTLQLSEVRRWYILLLQDSQLVQSVVKCTPLAPQWMYCMAKHLRYNHMIYLCDSWRREFRKIRYRRIIITRLFNLPTRCPRKPMTEKQFKILRAANPQSKRLCRYYPARTHVDNQ
jgi:hypothetical protein